MKAKRYKVDDALDGGFGVVSIEGEPGDIILRVISKWPGTFDQSCAVRLSKKHAVAIGRALVKLGGEKACRDVMSWAVDKLKKWEKLLVEDEEHRAEVSQYDVATCREIRMALDEKTNPRLAKGE